jgi:alpha-amylase
MKNLCFYFQVHQPFRLRQFHFFEIGRNDQYFDEAANEIILNKVGSKCYLPANRILIELIKKYEGKFKVSFSISGTALDQFELYAPEILQSFQDLAKTGQVEFLAETYAHSLSALKSKSEFIKQVHQHSHRIYRLFGKYPIVFRNTELIYSDQIGTMAQEMGFEAMITEGAQQILDWRSPNFLYCSTKNPKLKLLLKNYKLSDDIAFRFSNHQWLEWPLTTEKYANWLNSIASQEEIVNLFMDYETFGEHQWETSGIFDFLRALPEKVLSSTDFSFVTPSEAVKNLQPVASLHIPKYISWADEERDLSAWLGNELQEDAFESLYRLEEKVNRCKDQKIQNDWKYLQTSDHFYYMCTKYFSDGDVHKYFNPYHTPYEAFINYMNVLSDFEIRINQHLEENERTNNMKSNIFSNNIKYRRNKKKALMNLN